MLMLETWTELFFALGVILILLAFVRWCSNKLRSDNSPTPTLDNIRRLDDLKVREGLGEFLRNNDIVGSANIRDGKVIPMASVKDLEPVVTVLRDSYSRMMSDDFLPDLYGIPRRNTDMTVLIKDELDVVMLRKAFTLLEQVAEDRKKSRSMFRGITNDEVDSFVRAGMVNYAKTQGEPSIAQKVKEGNYDDTDEAGVARETLKLAFQIKGADL